MENIFAEQHQPVNVEDLDEIEEDTTPLLEDTEYMEKETGHSGKIETIDDFVTMLGYRARKGYDSTNAWCGIRNSGKSVGAQIVVSEFQKKMGREFNIKRDTMFKNASVDEVKLNIKSKPLRRGIILDEAENLFYRMDFHSQDQNELIKFLAFARIYEKHLFMLIPYFTDLRTSFRNSEISIWIQNIKQGFAAVFIQDTNIFTEDRWHMKENAKKWEKVSKGQNVLSPNKQLSIISKTVNYIGDFHIPKIDDEWLKEYKRLKLEALNIDPVEKPAGARERKYYDSFTKLVPLLVKKGYSAQAIAENCNISYSVIQGICKDLQKEQKPITPDILSVGEI
jgi:hypothetical protein